MYRCPKLVDVPVVLELPTGMYKSPLYAIIKDVDVGSCPEASVLEARQEAVLERLRTLKDQLSRLQSTRATAAAAAASVTPSLGAAAHSSPVKGQPDDLIRQQESVLYRLGRLKEQLGKLTAERDGVSDTTPERPITLAERHRGVLSVISALRDELTFLAELQKWMDERSETAEEEAKKKKEEEEEEGMEKQHHFVLRKLNALKEELKALVERLRRSAEAEEEDEMLLSVCGCLSASPSTPEASTVSSLRSSTPLQPISSSSKPLTVPSSSSSFSSLLSLPPPPPLQPISSSSKPLPVLSSSSSLLSLLPPPPSSLPSSSSSSISKTDHSTHGHIQDLVISASPSAPPLSLLLLRRLLAQAGSPVHSSSRLHSSIAKVTDKLQEAFTESPLGDRSKHSLAFALQWTDTDAPSLMVSPLRQTRISGEVNIARYIARLFPATSPLNFEATGTYTAIADVDQLLDALERQLVWGGGKGRQAVLRDLSARLGRSSFLCGEQCGVADIVAWSLLRQRGVTTTTAGQRDVVAWLTKMDALAAMDIDSLLPQQTKGDTSKKTTTTATKATAKGAGNVPSKPVESQSTAPKRKNHLGRTELEAYLGKLGITYEMREHKEVFTVEALMKEVKGVSGVVTKNLFLRDKKKKLYLLSTKHDTEVDLKTVAKQTGTKDLRFADESILLDTLGVRQGCVSALALINDASSHLVQFLVEQSALDPSVPFIHFHPMSNAATLGLTPSDLLKFLDATGHQPSYVTFQ